jgi:Ca2+-binding RTX toxin-like protein
VGLFLLRSCKFASNLLIQFTQFQRLYIMAQIKLQVGTKGDDSINGTSLSDIIFGRAGDDVINTLAATDLVFAGSGKDLVYGGSEADFLFGETGRDRLYGEDGDDYLDGGAGDDYLDGGLGNDTLFGGKGDDILEGGKGADYMYGGRGNDLLKWDDGDGSDIISGGAGRDTVAVEGSLTRGDNFVLNKNAEGKAIFQRTGLDNQAGIGQFTLTVDSSEIFDVSGAAGDDSLIVGDLSYTGVLRVKFDGGEGNDLFDASGSSVRVKGEGGTGDDTLIGSQFADTLVGGDGVDLLTGGDGRDRFVYGGNPFANGTVTIAANGIRVLNRPDTITDFNPGQDLFVLNGQDLGIDQLQFVEGTSGSIGTGNVINLTDGFANAAAAARAIADNDAITAEEGVFLYFNTTLGFNRLVYSTNLAGGGDISVLANMPNQTVLADQSNFSGSNFVLA